MDGYSTHSTDEETALPAEYRVGIYTEQYVADKLYVYISPFLLLMGGIGNSLSALVLTRKALRKTATSVFLVNLAVMDTLVLYRSLMWWWLWYTFKFDALGESDATCKVLMALTIYAIYMSPWSLVLVSCERFVAVILPTKHKIWFTRKRAMIQTATLNILVFFITLFNYWIMGTRNRWCNVLPEYMPAWNNYISQLHLVLSSLLPFIIMSLCSLAILVKLKMNRVKGDNKVSSVTRVMIMVNLVFLICTLPLAVYYASEHKIRAMAHTLKHSAIIYLIYAICNLLMYLNSSVNFVLYILFVKRFRAELFRLLGFKVKVEPATSATDPTTKTSRID